MILNDPIKPIFHGGNLDEAIAQHGGRTEDWLDLSTGINPKAYPNCALSDGLLNRLPGAGELMRLLEAARSFYGVKEREKQIAAANGTQAIIQILPQLFKANRQVKIIGPTYGEHAHCWKSQGHNIEIVDTIENLGRADIAVVVNPNNPDGKTYSRQQLSLLASLLNQRGGTLIIDEAFTDLNPGCSMANSKMGNIIVLKSFGKFFGLAGIRLGFMIANLSLIHQMNSTLGPWTVSGPALEIGNRALRDAAWIANNRLWIKQANQNMLDLFAKHKLEILGNGGLFVLVNTKVAEPLGLCLAEQHILVRQFETNPDYIRIGLCAGIEEEMRLDLALAKALGKADNRPENRNART